MAKKNAGYYKRLNDDMHDVYAERNILRTERDNARKSAEAYRKKLESAYADIERRESELREKESMSTDERLRMKYETMRERYIGMKSEIRRYRGVVKEMQRLLDANWANSDEGKDKLLVGRVQAYQNAIDMFKAAGYELRSDAE
jgi:hypothetical protein